MARSSRITTTALSFPTRARMPMVRVTRYAPEETLFTSIASTPSLLPKIASRST